MPVLPLGAQAFFMSKRDQNREEVSAALTGD